MNVTRADEERFIAMAALAGVTFDYNDDCTSNCRWMAHVPGIPADRQGRWMRKSRAALRALSQLGAMTPDEAQCWLDQYDLDALPHEYPDALA